VARAFSTSFKLNLYTISPVRRVRVLKDYGAELVAVKATRDALSAAGLEKKVRDLHALLASTGMPAKPWQPPAQHNPASFTAVQSLAAAVGTTGALLQPVPAATGAPHGPSGLRLPPDQPPDGGALADSGLAAFDGLSLRKKARFIFEAALKECPCDSDGRWEPADVRKTMIAVASRYNHSVQEANNSPAFLYDNVRMRLQQHYKTSESAAGATGTGTAPPRKRSRDRSALASGD